MKQPRGQGHRQEIQCNMHEQQAIKYTRRSCAFQSAVADLRMLCLVKSGHPCLSSRDAALNLLAAVCPPVP